MKTTIGLERLKKKSSPSTFPMRRWKSRRAGEGEGKLHPRCLQRPVRLPRLTGCSAGPSLLHKLSILLDLRSLKRGAGSFFGASLPFVIAAAREIGIIRVVIFQVLIVWAGSAQNLSPGACLCAPVAANKNHIASVLIASRRVASLRWSTQINRRSLLTSAVVLLAARQVALPAGSAPPRRKAPATRARHGIANSAN